MDLQVTIGAQLYDLGKEVEKGEAKDSAFNFQVDIQAGYQMIDQDLVFVIWIELSQTIVKYYQGTLCYRVLCHRDCLTCLRSKKRAGQLIRGDQKGQVVEIWVMFRNWAVEGK